MPLCASFALVSRRKLVMKFWVLLYTAEAAARPSSRHQNLMGGKGGNHFDHSRGSRPRSIDPRRCHSPHTGHCREDILPRRLRYHKAQTHSRHSGRRAKSAGISFTLHGAEGCALPSTGPYLGRLGIISHSVPTIPDIK